MKNEQKGITLVALIITVIVMLILAGVAINLTIGENGIFQKSKQSVGIHNKEEATEKVNLKITHTQMRIYAKSKRMPTLQEIANDFCEDEEVEYVELESKRVASVDKIELGEAKSFFTKLKKYPYEFEIDESLRLASIDGVKIANSQSELENIKNEFEEYKNTIANALTTNGIPTSKNDSLEIVVGNIDTLASSSKGLVKVAENISSRYQQKIDVTKVEGYANLTEENFIIEFKKLAWEQYNDKQDKDTISLQYDAQNGILTCSYGKYYWTDSNCTNWIVYDVYCKK